MSDRPRLLFTMGDVAGIGPEIIVRAWPELNQVCRPVVVGDAGWLGRALKLVRSTALVRPADEEPTPDRVPCLAGSRQDLSRVEVGHVSAAAGRAAYDFLCTAIDQTLAG